MPEMPEPIFFEDKGVFFTNFNELVRAHQNAANRVCSAEKKIASLNVGDGSDFASLDKKVKDFGEALDGVHVELEKVHAKLDKLFPEGSEGVPSAGPDKEPTTLPKPEAEQPAPAAEPVPATEPAKDPSPADPAAAPADPTPAPTEPSAAPADPAAK